MKDFANIFGRGVGLMPSERTARAKRSTKLQPHPPPLCIYIYLYIRRQLLLVKVAAVLKHTVGCPRTCATSCNLSFKSVS